MVDGTNDGGGGKTGMLIETIVFDGKKSLFDVGREGRKTDGSTVFILVDFEKQLAVPVQDLGGEFLGPGGEIAGGRQADEDLDVEVIRPAEDKN